jgi:hypothetical protein
MQAELRAANPAINTEILGIGYIGGEEFNNDMTMGRTLPWLQDTVNAGVWVEWSANWRDVIILDPLNNVVKVYNLTAHDLSNPLNYSQLKALFLDAAKAVDSDGDGLLDVWEMKYFGDLSATAEGDPDHDGCSNLSEFMFGSNPLDVRSTSKPKYVLTKSRAFRVIYRRWSGGLFNYFPETSSDLLNWDDQTRLVTLPRNLFDGSGATEVTITPKEAMAQKPVDFIRIRPVR